MIEISNKPHLWSIEKIQKSLSESQIALADIFESFVHSINNSENSIRAWETYKTIFLSAPENKPLSGVLIGVKDNINTIDFPTRMGSTAVWHNNSGGFDARVISKLRNNGCQIAGKTKTSELAVHLPTNTINPLYPDSIVGTSSSGSAAAVAAGHVSITIGTQTAGSIARPASFCGVLGFKPSFGDIPRTGVLKTTEKFDQVGFFGARVSDLIIIYNTAKVDGLDHPVHELRRKQIKKFNELVVLDYSTFKSIDKKLFLNFNNQIEKIAKINKFNLVYIPTQKLEKLRALHNSLYVSGLRTFLKNEINEVKISSNLLKFLNSFPIIQQSDISSYEKEIIETSNELKECYPNAIYCALASQFSAPKIGSDEGLDFNFAWTSFGFSQIVLPLLKDGIGKTVGLSLSAKQGSDLQLLDFAEELMPNSIYEYTE